MVTNVAVFPSEVVAVLRMVGTEFGNPPTVARATMLTVPDV